MKPILAGLFMLSALICLPHAAWGAGPPVVVSHTITSFEPGEIITAIDLTVSITNPGDSELSNLTLYLLPAHPWINPESRLEVENLAARQSVELPLHLEAPPDYDTRELVHRPLAFTGRYQGTDGAQHDFPVKSRPGGIK